MVIDCHYHLDPRIQPVSELLGKMDREGIHKVALMPTMCDPLPSTPEFLLRVLRLLLTHAPLRGIAKALAANFTPEGDIKLPKKTVPIYSDPDNDSVRRVMSDHPDRFLGWIFVNPRGRNDPVAEFEKWKDTPGFIGVKAHPFWHRYKPEELAPVAKKAAAAQKPVLAHVGFDSHNDFISLLEKVPGMKLILAHAGFPYYDDTWKLIRENKNIRVDLSATAYVDGEITRRAVDYLGVERCFFGTDGPYGHHGKDGTFDNGFIKRRIEALFLDSTVREKLLGANFMEFVGM